MAAESVLRQGHGSLPEVQSHRGLWIEEVQRVWMVWELREAPGAAAKVGCSFGGCKYPTTNLLPSTALFATVPKIRNGRTTTASTQPDTRSGKSHIAIEKYVHERSPPQTERLQGKDAAHIARKNKPVCEPLSLSTYAGMPTVHTKGPGYNYKGKCESRRITQCCHPARSAKPKNVALMLPPPASTGDSTRSRQG